MKMKSEPTKPSVPTHEWKFPKQEALTNELASVFHSQWQAARNFEPRWKTASKEWINQRKFNKQTMRELPDGKFEFDLANTSFEDLPAEWQKENFEAAYEAVDISWLEDRELAGSIIHEAWKQRNKCEEYNKHLFVDFKDLPSEEQEKDLLQFDLASKLFWREKSVSLLELPRLTAEEMTSTLKKIKR